MDLISRRAAIDLFPNDALEWDTKDGYVAPHLARRMIEQLPSAQPEIIRCENCAYYNWDCIDAPYGMTKMVCWCERHYDAGGENLAVNPDGYCKWAERRTDG
jgi:hypothetical protein